MAVSLSALPVERVRIGWRTRLQPAWSFDLAAIERAADLLGLTRPIVVGCIEGRRNTDGRAGERAFGHRICVRRTLSAHEASATLWHELAHAQQAERTPDFNREYDRATHGRGHDAYLANRYEAAARRMEARAGHHPLTKERP